jgi:pyruvate kinase
MTYGLAEAGQRILILAGTPFGAPGAANLLRLAHAPAHVPQGAKRARKT